MSLKSGHKIVPVIGEECQKQFTDFQAHRVGTVRFQPDGWFFTAPFIELADNMYEFKFKPTDVVIVSFPKCGATWTQEIVWTLLNNPNFDNPEAAKEVNVRCTFLEFDSIMKNFKKDIEAPGNHFYDMFVKLHPERNPKNGIFLQLAEFAKEPRIIKTHLSFSLLPPTLLDTCKVIYVARNPKDVAVSFCHHSRLLKVYDFQGNLSDFVDHLINDTVKYSPFWTHLKEGWERRHHPNLEYFFYEDMKADPKAEVSRLNNFLRANLSQKQIDEIVNYTSFSVMKEREEKIFLRETADIFVNTNVLNQDGGFFRKGESGDYKNKLTEEYLAKINDWTSKNMENFDEDFKYKI